ncbi:ABC transporter permease [Mycoplasma procyoni]|uniref:ABC transporter permease n=1 Tax=Mycoplasma procyoni TaxID=568784 RepID=UPI00197B99FA|nr:ABC transporter permease [Mycoplasma procyoni]MBN3534486.1 ABC transporter permease [Mycoplasma procyoni]
MNKSYFIFLNHLLWKKKSTIFIPLINLLIIIPILIINFSLQQSFESFISIFYVNILINGVLSSIFGSLKGLNIFKDLQGEGIEIIVFSKSITRKQIVTTKLVNFLFWGICWSLVSYFIIIIPLFFNLIYSQTLNLPFVWAFFSPLFIYLFFGLVSILVSLKFSSKIAISVPLLFFMPITIGGSLLSSYSTSSANKFAQDLNIEYPNYDSGRLLDVEKFYLNNNKDEFYIIPKKVDNATFSAKEKEFLELAQSRAKNSSTAWQIYALLATPYQFLDVYNTKDKDALSLLSKANNNNLNNYLYYNNLESGEKSYKLSLNTGNLLKLPTQDKDNPLETINKFIVPGSLKNNSQFSDLKDREIVYARENASNFDVSFPEDEKVIAVPDDLVGKLKWSIISQALESKAFSDFAHKLFKNTEKTATKEQILNLITSAVSTNVSDDQLNFSSVIDNNVELLKEVIDTQKIRNITEKKIYFATALIYFLYFNTEYNDLLKTLLKTENSINETYDPAKFDIKIDDKKYTLGGYSSYSAIQKTVDNKVIYRFSLENSNNFLFQSVDEVYSYHENQKVVISRNLNIIIWLVIISILGGITFEKFRRKDYK